MLVSVTAASCCAPAPAPALHADCTLTGVTSMEAVLNIKIRGRKWYSRTRHCLSYCYKISLLSTETSPAML